MPLMRRELRCLRFGIAYLVYPRMVAHEGEFDDSELPRNLPSGAGGAAIGRNTV
jgi:hypothetical protein